jgi:hypothetical protein
MGDLGVSNSLLITRGGTIKWNGSPVSETDVRGYVDNLKIMSPIPELKFHAESGASCAAVMRLQHLMQPACITDHIDKCIQLNTKQWRPLEEGRKSVPTTG